jgi:hypothetical protein
MKSNSLWVAIVGLSLFAASAPAITRYVNLNSTNPVPPYSSWATAATNIQDAIDYPDVGPFAVFVTNGIYQTGISTNNGLNRVTIRNSSILVKSVNGPAVTIIRGCQMPGTTNGASSVRCVYLANGATFSGFTLTNGSTTGNGGGIYCSSSTSIVSNCIITGNAAGSAGGGGYSGTYINCLIGGNTASNGGGIYSGSATNCTIIANLAQYGGGIYGVEPYNCTIVGNAASVAGGGVRAGPGGGYMYNCVIYYNTAPSGSNHTGAKMNYCCTTPIWSSSNSFTNEPLFVDPATGNFRLQPGSPCINAGTNSYVKLGTDLDGNPRIRNGTVDMGAYEFQAPIHYVNLNNATPVSPFTNWPAAATNIQDAIDAANAGDFIVVSNGIYNYGGRAVYGAATNRVVADKAVTVQSVNGPAATIVAGSANTTYPPAGIRCVYLTNGAVLNGFTLTNGSARNSGNQVQEQSGGGVWCEDNSAVVSNCVFTGNSGAWYGGGAFRGTLLGCTLTNNTSGFGGAACSNLLVNCALLQNTAAYNNLNSGGGAYFCTLSNCLVTGNQSLGGGSSGGGVFAGTAYSCSLSNNAARNGGGACFGVLYNCLVSSNRASNYGGGARSNTLNNCVIRGNSAVIAGGGAISSTLNNCLLTGNFAGGGGGGSGGGASDSTLVNCTIARNIATAGGGGTASSALTDCVNYYNIGGLGDNNSYNGILNYCCTTPLPTNGVGNITNEPAFGDLANGNFHLQSNSPCINAGNNAAVPGSTDLDGNPRIVGGNVDMGAYECQSPALLAYYTWLQNYGLPTHASAINADADGDGMNNWQEWQSDTVPTNALSLLQMMTVADTVSGMMVTWQSVSGKTYFLQRSSDLIAQPAFSTIASDIVGQTGTTSFTDTTAVGPGPFFYRVGVQP